jgi:hypothetical protein
MARHEVAVGLIRCRAPASTINAVVSPSGLRAKATNDPELFYLADSGRDIDPEIERELFSVAQHELDRAVRIGIIPSWSRCDDDRVRNRSL